MYSLTRIISQTFLYLYTSFLHNMNRSSCLGNYICRFMHIPVHTHAHTELGIPAVAMVGKTCWIFELDGNFICALKDWEEKWTLEDDFLWEFSNLELIIDAFSPTTSLGSVVRLSNWRFITTFPEGLAASYVYGDMFWLNICCIPEQTLKTWSN